MRKNPGRRERRMGVRNTRKVTSSHRRLPHMDFCPNFHGSREGRSTDTQLKMMGLSKGG